DPDNPLTCKSPPPVARRHPRPGGGDGHRALRLHADPSRDAGGGRPRPGGGRTACLGQLRRLPCGGAGRRPRRSTRRACPRRPRRCDYGRRHHRLDGGHHRACRLERRPLRRGARQRRGLRPRVRTRPGRLANPGPDVVVGLALHRGRTRDRGVRDRRRRHRQRRRLARRLAAPCPARRCRVRANLGLAAGPQGDRLNDRCRLVGSGDRSESGAMAALRGLLPGRRRLHRHRDLPGCHRRADARAGRARGQHLGGRRVGGHPLEHFLDRGGGACRICPGPGRRLRPPGGRHRPPSGRQGRRRGRRRDAVRRHVCRHHGAYPGARRAPRAGAVGRSDRAAHGRLRDWPGDRAAGRGDRLRPLAGVRARVDRGVRRRPLRRCADGRASSVRSAAPPV
ncbi:MAG: Uncharacterized MFS-type transporter, partial [uncultured Thermomicrobiales bacterium]